MSKHLRDALLTAGIVALSNTATANLVPDGCSLYGINDKGLNDSQFVVIEKDGVAPPVVQLGPTYEGADIEAIDISSTGDFYASSGDNQGTAYAGKAGHLYEVNKDTGAIASIGNIHFIVDGQDISGKEISSLAFNPVDGTLWGWAEFCGLFRINPPNLAPSSLDPAEWTPPQLEEALKYTAADLMLVYPSKEACLNSTPDHLGDFYVNGVEDMTWDLAGDKIYFTFGEKKSIFVFTPATGAVDIACEFKTQVEAIKMLPDGDLLVNTHNSTQFTKIDLPTCEAVEVQPNASPFKDIEGFAWECPCTASIVPGPNPVTIPLNDSKGSAYTIELVNHDGNQWTYTVSHTGGRELSHWDLGLGQCASRVTDTDGGELVADHSTPADFYGIKWDTKGGTFTITMDKEYPVGTVDVLVKAGGKGSSGDNYYAIGQVAGPSCACE